MAERKLVYLVVGTNKGMTTPTWFYTFGSYKAALAFLAIVTKRENWIDWEPAPYPCAVDTCESGLESFESALVNDEPEP